MREKLEFWMKAGARQLNEEAMARFPLFRRGKSIVAEKFRRPSHETLPGWTDAANVLP